MLNRLSDIAETLDARGYGPGDETARIIARRDAASIRNVIKKMTSMTEALSIIVANAVLIPDPQMKGFTDTFAVPLDDIESARAVLGGGK